MDKENAIVLSSDDEENDNDNDTDDDDVQVVQVVGCNAGNTAAAAATARVPPKKRTAASEEVLLPDTLLRQLAAEGFDTGSLLGAKSTKNNQQQQQQRKKYKTTSPNNNHGGLSAFAHCGYKIKKVEHQESVAFILPVQCQGDRELENLMKTAENMSRVKMEQDGGDFRFTLSAFDFKLTTTANQCFQFSFVHSVAVTDEEYGSYGQLLMQKVIHHHEPVRPAIQLFCLEDGVIETFNLSDYSDRRKELKEKDMRKLMLFLGLSSATTAEVFMTALLAYINVGHHDYGYKQLFDELEDNCGCNEEPPPIVMAAYSNLGKGGA